jgi:hypothetical protein
MAWTISKASSSATGNSARPAPGSVGPEAKHRSQEIAQVLRDASAPEIQIVDTSESPETTVNAALTGGRQQIDRTLVRIAIDLLGRGVESNYADKTGIYFLGVNWGHLNLVDGDFEFVRDRLDRMHPEEWRVRVNTGMMGVVPSWKALELLSSPEVRQLRVADEIRKGEELSAQMFEEMLSTLDVSEEKKRAMRQQWDEGSEVANERRRALYRNETSD